MDNVKGDESFPQHNTFGDVAESADDVYDTEDTDDDNMVSQYEFAPRVVVTPPVSKKSHGGRNSLTDWTEHETFVLLDAWGERLLRNNRRSVSSEEWYEVADKVSEVSKFKRTKTQCRNRLDTLKRKYKTETAMFAENIGYSSNWVFFSKMDTIVSSSLNRANGNLKVHPSCAKSSDEMKQIVNFEIDPNYVNSSDEMKQIANSEAHPNCFNSSNETKDNFEGDSESAEGGNDNIDDLPRKNTKMAKEDNLVSKSKFVKRNSENLDDRPPKSTRMGRNKGVEGPFRLLANCINKFGHMYEKVESSKREQLVELEQMRMDFQRDLEVEKRKILKRGQAEIAKMWGVNIEETDLSPGNVSG